MGALLKATGLAELKVATISHAASQIQFRIGGCYSVSRLGYSLQPLTSFFQFRVGLGKAKSDEIFAVLSVKESFAGDRSDASLSEQMH